ncbi:MAG TPA: hypothetical protein VLC51_01050, partial [Nitrospira sp.]|nr:hypothetical protein [Nitrospira sp.]
GVWTSSNAWTLSASPTSVSFKAIQGGGNPASQSVSVSKPNNKTTNWTASDSATWVSVTPLTGSITNSAQVGIAVNIGGLAAGTYSATVTVTASKGGSVAIPVTLTVSPSTTTSSSTLTTSTNTASLNWDASTDTTVVGYKVYMGTASGVYGAPITVGNVTSYLLNNLSIATYYFVVTDYDANGNESLPSNEVSKSVY